MTRLLQALSFVGLALTVVPAFLVFADMIVWDTHATLMLVGAILWFATSPFWVQEDVAEAAT